MLKELNKVLGKLATTNRYSDTRLINPESVLEHTGYVALLSMFIVNRLNEEGEQLDESKALRKALVHDIEESITGDIINPTKYANSGIHLHLEEYASNCAWKLLKKLPGWPDTFTTWNTAKSNPTGMIVAIADKLAVVYKMEQEILKFGNLHLKESLFKGDTSALANKLNEMKIEVSQMFNKKEILIDLIDEGIQICEKISKST